MSRPRATRARLGRASALLPCPWGVLLLFTGEKNTLQRQLFHLFLHFSDDHSLLLKGDYPLFLRFETQLLPAE